MILLGTLMSIAAIGILCWLLFTLAVHALPFFIALHAGAWAYGAGVGWLGAILAGLAAAALTLAIGAALLVLLRPVWARLLVGLAFVVPAGLAGFHATRGVAGMFLPSEAWQLAFAVVGAIAVGLSALGQVAGIAASGSSSGAPVRA